MKTIELKVTVADVLLEVARTAGYVGSKVPDKGDAEVYDRVSVVDEDEKLLLRFFDECRGDVVQVLSGNLESEGVEDSVYTLRLRVHDGYNEALVPALELKLKQYFTDGVTAKWFMCVGKGDIEGETLEALSVLEGLRRMTMPRVFERRMNPMW